MHHRRCSSPIRIVHINPLWGRPAVSELTGVDIGDSNMTLYDILAVGLSRIARGEVVSFCVPAVF